jgi:hypothetical protein
MSGLRLKPPGQEVPVHVLHDGLWHPGLLWAWQRTWTGRWGAWVRGDGLPERCWNEDEIRVVSGADLPFQDQDGVR